jgi:lipopolysaccharide/colanic/teichoic acid biosynthesis glycosyltransferase
MSDGQLRIHTLPPGGTVPQQHSPHGGERARSARRRLTVVAWLFSADIISGALAIATIIGASRVAQMGVWLWPHAVILLLLLTGSCCAVGLYRDCAAVRNPVERFRLRANAMLLFVFTGALLFLREDPLEAVTIVSVSAMLALVWGLWIEHWVCARLIGRGLWCARAAILGDAAAAYALARRLRAHPEWGLDPVGIIADGHAPQANADRETFVDDPALPILGALGARPVPGFEVLIVSDARALPPQPSALYRLGAEQVLVMTETAEFPTFGLQIRHFDGCIAVEMGGSPRAPSLTLKRMVDLVLGLPLALLCTPVVAVLALAVKYADPGPAFYRQRRVGREGGSIDVLKLRTMYSDAERRLQQMLDADPAMRLQWEHHFKLPHDPRILPGIGGFLRRTSLDELPQIWNVIRGDMSLVGPRPFPAYHMDAFDSEFQTLRMSVPPGLTGFWQISARGGDLAAQRAKDCFYIRHRSLWLDLYVLMATLPAVIKGQGAK